MSPSLSQMGEFNLRMWKMTQQSNPGLFAFQETLQVHKKSEEKKWEWSKHDAESLSTSSFGGDVAHYIILYGALFSVHTFQLNYVHCTTSCFCSLQNV